MAQNRSFSAGPVSFFLSYFNRISFNRPELYLILTALVLSITPIYGFSYFVSVYFGLKYLPALKTFPTLFGKAVVAILLLGASIMFVGIAQWLVGFPKINPVYVFIVYMCQLYIVSNRFSPSGGKPMLFDKEDSLALAISFIAPTIIIVSFFMPHFSKPALYQFLSNGWDNASHILMLETASIENGYVYGDAAEVKKKTIESRFNSYPQSWHVVTSNLANGFIARPFNFNHGNSVLFSYLVSVLIWYILASYIFVRLCLRLLRKSSRFSSDPAALVLATVIILAIQSISLWGLITWGFANYIGLVTYTFLVYALIFDTRRKKNPGVAFLIVPAVAGAILCWYLVLPALLTTAVLFFAKDLSLRKQDIKPRFPSLQVILIYIFGASYLFFTFLQLIIFLVFNRNSTEVQLLSSGGIFSISNALLAIIVIFAIFYWVASPKIDRELGKNALIILMPMSLFSFFIYVVQQLVNGDVSYYFYKVSVVLFLAAGIFAVPAFVSLTLKIFSTLKIPKLSTVLLGISILSLLFIGTTQNFDAAGRLLQVNTKVSYVTASKIVSFIDDSKNVNSYLMVITNDENHPNENFNGELYRKVMRTEESCLNEVMTKNNRKNVDMQVAKLKRCALTMKGHEITVLSDRNVIPKLTELELTNLRIVDVNN